MSVKLHHRLVQALWDAMNRYVIMLPTLMAIVGCGSANEPKSSLEMINIGDNQVNSEVLSYVPSAGEPISAVEWLSAAAAEEMSVEQMLEMRASQYTEVLRGAQVQGAIGGALRGGLIGSLLLGTTEGAFMGAVLGSGIGAASSEYVATQLVAEHQNYLIRRLSLERVIESAKLDTESTHLDLLLSRKALLPASEREVSLDSRQYDRLLSYVSEFHRQAELRVLTLREVIAVYETHGLPTTELSSELRSQAALLNQMRELVRSVRGE